MTPKGKKQGNVPAYLNLTADMTSRLVRFFDVCNTKTANRIVASKLKEIKQTKGTLNILELATILKKLL